MGDANARPRPWIAAILSVLSGGLGHVYAGRWKFALSLLISIWIVSTTLLLSIAKLGNSIGLVLILFCSILVKFLIVIHSYRCAKRAPSGFSKSQKWYSLIGFLIFAGALSLANDFIVKIYSIPTATMKETIQPGDRVVVDLTAFGWFGSKGEDPKRGDVIVFKWDHAAEISYIKRIVGVPGDLVEVIDGAVIVNGSKVLGVKPADSQFLKFETLSLGGEEYFVLGDGSDSMDSRHKGAINRAHIRGKARLVVWSFDSESRSFRWGRMGHKVE